MLAFVYSQGPDRYANALGTRTICDNGCIQIEYNGISMNLILRAIGDWVGSRALEFDDGIFSMYISIPSWIDHNAKKVKGTRILVISSHGF